MSKCSRCHAPNLVVDDETGWCTSCIDAVEQWDQDMRRGFSPPPDDIGRCRAITKNTLQCRKKATFGSLYCGCHTKHPPKDTFFP